MLRRHDLRKYDKSDESCYQARNDRLAELNAKEHASGNMLQINNNDCSASRDAMVPALEAFFQ